MPVHLKINSIDIETSPGKTLFDHAEQHGIQVPTSCLKQGKCRECLMEIVAGMDLLSDRAPEEAHLTDNFRLSCRAQVVGTSGTVKCHTMRRAALRIVESGTALAAFTRTDQIDPAVTRAGNQIFLSGEPIAQSPEAIHGLAMDLGTTTVVLRLIDLETGQLVASTSFENPQRFGGSDVMARIKYDSDHKGKLLQRVLLGYLSRAIESLPVDPATIYELTVAGNSTMRDLFFGLNVESIGQKPYRSLTEHEFLDHNRTTTSLAVEAKRLRLPIHPAARVYGLPLVSGHVGADAAACLLAIDMPTEDRLVAVMDIGTNTEVFLGNRNRILAASCPAGPAFEGGAIACGMPGLEGAIERVQIQPDGTFRNEVIGEVPAEGICGSGLVDLLSELVRTGQMNEMGRFRDGRDSLVIDPQQNVFLRENDVSELAQAKGANVTGMQIVMKEYGIQASDIDCFYLAGGFARHIDPAAARRIGLIPDLPDEKIKQLGNAAIEGATLALVSQSRRHELERLVQSIKHVELETDPGFFEFFVEGCQFKRAG